jgi:hypothetical protein
MEMKILAMLGNVNRREFLRGLARYGLLALMAVLTGAVLRKNRDPKCLKQGPCGGCPVFAECTLPPALSNKRS